MPKSPVRRAEHRRTAALLRELDEELRPLRAAYLAADAVLREATREAKGRSRYEWMQLRTRLSALDTARQQHLMAERDELPALPIGSVQAIDTGMSGPAIGFHLHGRSKDPGTPARYGVDVEAELRAGEGAPELVAEAEVATGSTTREQPAAHEELVTAS